MHQLPISCHRANRFLHNCHLRQPDTDPGLTDLARHPGNRTNVRFPSIVAHDIVTLIEAGHLDHLPVRHHQEGEVRHDVEVQVPQSRYDPHLLEGEKCHLHGMTMISNQLPHTLTLTIHLILGNHLSSLHQIQITPHIRTIHHHPNTPLHGNQGQHGPTGTSPTILHSPQDNGRTTKSPTISPTRRANGLTTQNHHRPTPPHTTLPLVPLLHSPQNLLTATAIPNAINADPDLFNPDSPHSLQGMSRWIYMVPASIDGKPT